MKTLGWGLLSTARINRSLIEPLRASARNRLVAVASRDAARAEAYAREHEIGRAHGSYEALLADPDVHVVYNPLPNSLHAEWTIKAAAAGKHVLCEKPLALTVAEVDAMAEAARRAGVVVAEAFMYRHHPQTLAVRDLVQSGRLGRVRYVRGSFSFSLSRPGDVRLDPALGGGALWDVGCYPVSYARFVLGREPVEVFGCADWNATGIDDTFTAELRFPDGVLAQADASFRLPFRTVMEIVGEDARLLVPQPFKPGADAAPLLVHGDTTEAVPVPAAPLYAGEVEDLADAVLLGRPPRVTLQDSRATVASLVALYESARRRAPVAVSPGPA
jgi:predicted dehydrogenase